MINLSLTEREAELISELIERAVPHRYDGSGINSVRADDLRALRDKLAALPVAVPTTVAGR